MKQSLRSAFANVNVLPAIILLAAAWILFSVVLSIAITGCVPFTTAVFRSEQVSVDAAYTAYQGYTNGLASGAIKVTPAESNEIKQARLKFANTVITVDQLRAEAETNSTVKPVLQTTLTTLSDQSSNIVWLISFVRAK